MKINKDNIVGAIVMLLVIAVVVWGVMLTSQVQRVSTAHDNLVGVLSPVITQIQQANAQMRAQVQRPAPRPEVPPVAPEAPKTK